MRVILFLSTFIAAAAAQCRPGWQQRNGFCYELGEDKMTYFWANEDCYDKGAFLAEPWSTEENEAVKSLLQGTKEDVWIGAFKLQHDWYGESNWQELEFSDWAIPSAADKDGGKYAFFSHSQNFKWDTADGSGSKRFMCQTCPDTKVCFEDSCYFLGCFNADLKGFCGDQGAYLAEINSDAEKDFIDKFLEPFSSPFKIGIGAKYDSATKRWVWNKAQTTSDLDVVKSKKVSHTLEKSGKVCLNLKRTEGASTEYFAGVCGHIPHYLCEEPK